MAESFHCWLKLPDASSASQPALPSRRETFQRSDVPLLTLLQDCCRKLLKQWNSFVEHCLTWMTNYWLSSTWHFLLAVLAIFYVVTLQLWWRVTEYSSSMGWVGLRKLDPCPCLAFTSLYITSCPAVYTSRSRSRRTWRPRPRPRTLCLYPVTWLSRLISKVGPEDQGGGKNKQC